MTKDASASNRVEFARLIGSRRRSPWQLNV